MRRALLIIPMVAVLSSCRNENNDSRNVNSASTSTTQVKKEKVLLVPWGAVLNVSTQKMELIHDPKSDVSQFTVQDMIDALNLKYPKITLQYQERRKDTLQVAIKNADYLTQGLGSSGAEMYFAEATFSLTELKGIRVVYFSFKEGDHAASGAFSRKDFHGFN